MQHSLYHTILRTSALTLAFVLLFQSGTLSPLTHELSEQTERYLANAIGMYAAVPPNEFNQITAALTAKENELASREATLHERELAVGINDDGSQPTPDYTTFILSSILFILLVLIVINYILDYRRGRLGRLTYG